MSSKNRRYVKVELALARRCWIQQERPLVEFMVFDWDCTLVGDLREEMDKNKMLFCFLEKFKTISSFVFSKMLSK